MKHTTKTLAFLAFAASASSAVAAFAPITTATAPTVSGTPDTKFLQSFNVAGSLTAIPAATVVKGTTTATPAIATATARMDDFDFNTVASGLTGSSIIKTVAFGTANFTDYNGSQPDFFLFEAGATPDTISIAAILSGGALGPTVNVPTGITASSWGDTLLKTTLNANANTDQKITGICWDITDLGVPAGSTIEGVAIISGFGIDPVGFYAVAPPSGISRFAVTASSPHPVGEEFSVTITAQTSGGATVNDSTTTVSIGSSTAGSLMEFDWDSNGTYGDSSGVLDQLGSPGTKIIKARNFKAQTVSLVATAGGTTTISPPDVTTIAGAYTKLQILAPGETTAIGTTATGKTGTPSIRSLNSPFDVTVNAVDQYWNPVVTTNTVSFSSTDGTATLPPPAAPLVNGLYSITLNSAGAFTATATDDTDGTKTASTTGVMTTLGAPITWVGAENDKWDTTSLNWIDGAPVPVSVVFANANQVTFSQNGVSSVNIDGTVTPSLVTVNSNNTINYIFAGSGSIAGAVGGFNKSGTSTLTVSTANTYTGKTTVSGGVLLLDNATALPSASPLVLNSGILGLKSGGFTRAIGTAVGQVTIGTSNGATQAGFAAFGANRMVNLGGASAPLSWGVDNFFTLLNTFALGSSESDFTVDFQNPINFGTTTRIFFVDGLADVDATLSGAITGGAGLTKNGPGTLKLSNSGNAYTGATLVNEGTLLLGASEVLPSSNNTVVKRTNTTSGNEVYLDINGFNETIGTLELADEGSSSSATNANQEPSIINTATGPGAAAILQVNGTITYLNGTGGINGQAMISANLSTGTGTRTINVGESFPTEDLVISGSLTGESINKTGLGTLAISTPRNTGNTTVTAGTLILRSANPNNDASTVTVAATTTLNLDYTGTDKVARLIISGVTLPDGVYTNTTPQITGDGTITVESPYVTWSGGAPFTGDENNDGVQNGLAWLLGAANPNVNANGLLPLATSTSGALNMTFSMLNAASRGNSVLEVQHSSDLGISDPWTGVVVPNATNAIPDNGVTFVITSGSPLNAVQATIAPSEAAGGKVFGRLKGVK